MNKYDSTVIFNKTPSSFMGNAFLDSSLLGNGRVGVAILGAIANEQILINHGDLHWKGKTGVLQDISDEFNTVRKYMNDGKIIDAEKVLERTLQKKNCNLRHSQPLPMAKIQLNFVNSGIITDYERTTDMRNGELAVSYKTADGETLRRTSISRTDDIIAYNIIKKGGKISVGINLQSCVPPTKFTTMKCEGGYLYFSSVAENGKDYGLVVRVITANGMVDKTDNGVTIKDSTEITLLAKAFANADKDDSFLKIKLELSNIRDNYNKLASKNSASHKRLFEDCSLNLSTEKTSTDMEELIKKTNNGELTPEIVERTWNFAKYLLICSGSQYLTPAGLWCADTECDNGMLAFSGTAQLLYMGLTRSVAPDLITKLLEYFIEYESDLRKNSARIYGMRGFFVPNTIAPESAIFGATDSKTLHFIASSALAANVFYSYYLATGDEKTLKSKIFPFMRDVFDFYSDFLKLGSNGKYITVPSYSPNSTPGNLVGGKPLHNFNLAASSTIDFLAIKNLLNNLIDAAKTLGTAKADIAVWEDMTTKIPTFAVNGNGALREYTNSVFIDKAQNAGIMHGFGLYPLKQFVSDDERLTYRPNQIQGSSPEASILTSTASANAVKERIIRASGMQDTNILAIMANQLVYANDTPAVLNLLIQILSSSVSPSGLFLSNDWRGSGLTANGHTNFDMSAQIGFATAITEGIISSDKSTLKILPVLFDAIAKGEIKNIVTDFAATVSLSWDAARGRLTLKILSNKTTKIDIIFNDAFRKLKSKDLIWDKHLNGLRDIALTAGKPLTIDLG